MQAASMESEIHICFRKHFLFSPLHNLRPSCDETWRMCLTGLLTRRYVEICGRFQKVKSKIPWHAAPSPRLSKGFPSRFTVKPNFSQKKRSLYSGDLSILKWWMVHWCLLRREREEAGEVKRGSWSSVYLLFVSYCMLLDSHQYRWEDESRSIRGRKWTVLNWNRLKHCAVIIIVFN